MGQQIEERLAILFRQGQMGPVATLALEAYGPEVLAFLRGIAGNEADAADLLSQVAEDLWRGLPTFRFGCSMRTWLYVLARHANARFRRGPWNQAGKRIGDEQLDSLVKQTRTITRPWMKTDVKDQWRTIRESLEPDDRALLVLRVDQKMDWKEIARITLGEGDHTDADLVRESNRMRKRFQSLRSDLRLRAQAAGLLD